MVFFIVLTGLSCQESSDLPLPEEKLVPVLVDIHIAEAGLALLTGPPKDSAAMTLYDQIFAIHGVRKEDVDSSLSILKHSPELMKEIYSEVKERMEDMKNRNEPDPDYE